MRILIALCAGILPAAAANAALLVEYTSIPAGPITAGTVDPSVTADPLAAGAGIAVASGGTFNWNGWDTDNNSFADAVADDEVWTWGFDVTAAGTTVTPTTMNIRLDRSGTGPDDFEIVASVNSGSNISLLTYDYNDTSDGVNFLDVSLAGLGTLTQGDSVVFTLAAFNSEGTGGTFDLETITFPGGTDSLQIFGDVAVVPEPGTVALALLSLASVGAISMRSRLG